MSLSISTTIKKYPSLPYAKIKDAVLGERYSLSLIFIGPTRALSLNKKYRNATYIPNVLSFPLTPETGEIYICPKTARSEAGAFSLSAHGYIGYLFIHGLLHLKGCTHGDTMEEVEKKYVTQFKLQ